MTTPGNEPHATQPPAPGRSSRLSRAYAVTQARIGAAARRALPRVRRAARRELPALPALVRERARAVMPDCAPWVRAWLGSSSWGPRAAAVATRFVRFRLYLILAVLGAVLVWFGLVQSTHSWMLLAPAGALEVPLGLATAVVIARERYRQSPYARTRDRFGADGWADSWDLHRGPSSRAAREIAARQRPTLSASLPPAPSRDEVGVVPAAVGQLQRARAIDRLPVTECGTWLGRSAVGPWWGTDCYAAHRDVVGLIAPPQTGKTALMIHHVIDHPGAVISTSTKPEIYLYTAALRAAVSGPDEVALFNPDNLAGLGSNLRWCPVRGCADYRFAAARAALLVGEPEDEQARRWTTWGASALTGLLMVADLAGLSLEDVARWVHHQDEDTPGGVGEALALMRGRYRGQVPAVVVDALTQLVNFKIVKTRDSVFFAMRDAVAFMADPEIAWLCTPGRDEPAFDVERFIERRGVLYLLGSEEQDNSTAPLLAAFTGYIISAARRLATMRPSGRLDPPLLGSLDEVALITPIPLPNLVTDAGGRGIHFEWSVQTPSQLRDRWGDDGAKTILNATNALLVFGGLKDTEDLEEASGWCGYRHEFVPDPDGPEGSARAKNERVPVCPADRVRLIPQWHALLVYRTTPATVIRMWPGWERDDVRAAGPPPQMRTRVSQPCSRGDRGGAFDSVPSPEERGAA